MRNLCLSLLFFLPLPVMAQTPEPDVEVQEESMPSVPLLEMLEKAGARFTHGPARQGLGGQADISVPKGYIATDGNGSRTVLKFFDNLTADNEVGLFAPENFGWFITFDWDDIGYVKDDEKNELDPDAMLKAMQENNIEVNKIKREQGMRTFTLVNFAVAPNYNPDTHNLEWAVRLKDDENGSETINYNVKILGRDGVMVVTLICNPQDMSGLLPEFRQHLQSFAFLEGRRYADFREGDKIAKAGLSALVVGGGLAIAAKTGLLKKLLKPLILVVVAAGAWLKKIFAGRSGNDPS